MEPNFDKLVSNKIRHTEQRLVSWNKQAVWEKVQSETNATRHSYYFHYAAAALTLLLVYFGVQLIPKGVNPQVTDAKITSALEATEPEKKSVPEKNQNHLPDQTDQNPEDNATVPASEIPNAFRKAISLIQRDAKDVDAVIEPVVTEIKIQEEKFLFPAEDTVHEQKIRPIVGVITESYSEDVANVKQKKSLHKLELPEPVPWENFPNALVFARKK